MFQVRRNRSQAPSHCTQVLLRPELGNAGEQLARVDAQVEAQLVEQQDEGLVHGQQQLLVRPRDQGYGLFLH